MDLKRRWSVTSDLPDVVYWLLGPKGFYAFFEVLDSHIGHHEVMDNGIMLLSFPCLFLSLPSACKQWCKGCFPGWVEGCCLYKILRLLNSQLSLFWYPHHSFNLWHNSIKDGDRLHHYFVRLHISFKGTKCILMSWRFERSLINLLCLL